MYRDVDGT
jgi:hypothetical protein